ncbi:MAG TPA: hypothetical protein VM925_00125, partial [Labilithrix sp.]|nr:hypothetical protein [Labilithrix sp.]
MSAAKAKKDSEKNWQLAGSSWAGAWKVFAGAGVVGLALAGFGYTQDARRFAFSWLFAFITVLTIALGALFFVLIQRLTSAGWSVTVRRTAEFFGIGIVALVPLFIPVLLSMNHLFPWLGHHGAEHGEHAKPEQHGSLNLIKPAYAQDHAGQPDKTPEPHAGPTHGQPPPAHVGDPAGKLPGSLGGPPDDSPHPGAHGAAGHAAHADRPGVSHAPGAHGPAGDPHALIHKEIIAKKAPYLNKTFFLVRVIIYFAVWVFLAWRLFGYSTAQDKTKDPKLTLKAQAFAPAATFLYALTLTFAAFDWIMSL